MRWRMLGLIACSLALVSLTACGTPGRRIAAFQITRTKAAVIPPVGLLFMRAEAPVIAGVSGKPIGRRVGEASVNAIAIPPNPFGIPAVSLISWGDMSKKTAAANGGIKEVTHADYRMTVVLMFFRRVTLIVYGD